MRIIPNTNSNSLTTDPVLFFKISSSINSQRHSTCAPNYWIISCSKIKKYTRKRCLNTLRSMKTLRPSMFGDWDASSSNWYMGCLCGWVIRPKYSLMVNTKQSEGYSQSMTVHSPRYSNGNWTSLTTLRLSSKNRYQISYSE